MTTTMIATFDGKVLIPSGEVDLPKGTSLRLQVEMEDAARAKSVSLADLPACGIWADRDDLGDTPAAASNLRRLAEFREGRSK